ncbi:MAG: hypothetical protein AAGA08_17675 [Pseudomonadota bacterium]
MFRIAAVLCLVASSAQADTLIGYAHSHDHGYVGSFTNPINYRPNRTPGFVAVRTSGYTEANTLIVKRAQEGVTTGTTATPGQASTGQNLTGLELVPYK